MYHSHHLLPCLHCHPYSYIRLVQHLIERCLLLRMTRDQCVKALAEYARIKPIITLVVWRELLKENRGFFHAYFRHLYSRTLLRGHVHQLPRFTRRRQWR
ncbi:hypothetical protein Nepgr_003427 [Nepenthes gracilis]|uniref:Uncharacterized protein n=1 Tax=Nepenthes gracilis TaxID=150966 RepID=A0AAD3XDK5_NEPGR|nr:hypothetical protein Nepgr_003427 [Nepenthes gracilis]